MTDSSPNSWIAQLRVGSRAAFDAIYRQESPVVYGYLLRLTRRRDVAADLFQNVWLKLVAHAPRLAPDTRIRAWLLTVAHNEVRSHYRASRWDVSRLLLLARSLSPTPHAFEPDVGLDLERALGRLDASDREALLLEAVSDLGSEEICKILRLSPEAWRKRLSRARARLDAQLELSSTVTLEHKPS